MLSNQNEPASIIIDGLKITPDLISNIKTLQHEFGNCAGKLLLSETSLTISADDVRDMISQDFFFLLKIVQKVLYSLDQPEGGNQ